MSEPTIEYHIVNFKSANAEALFIAGTGRFAAQAIRRSNEIGWKPITIINFPSGSTAGTIVPAGVDNSVGVVTGTFSKDPNDPKWNDDPDMANYRTIFANYLPGADIADTGYLIGYRQGMLLKQLLRQCGDDLSRENILRQARSSRTLCSRPFCQVSRSIPTKRTVRRGPSSNCNVGRDRHGSCSERFWTATSTNPGTPC